MFKLLKIIGLVLIILLVVSPTSSVDGQDELIGVRIPRDASRVMQLNQGQVDVMIDYGSFIWMVIPSSNLTVLDAAGIPFQAYPNPYALTLGGSTFDPLFHPALPDISSSSKIDSSEPGLHLVQFQGPTKSTWLNALQAQGLEIVQYIHPFTYMVWGSLDQIEGVTARSFTRWAGEFLPQYGLQPNYRGLPDNLTPVQILLYPAVDLEATLKTIAVLGGSNFQTRSGLDPVFHIITCTLPGERLMTVASLPGVFTVQPVPIDGGLRGEMSSQVNAGNVDSQNHAFTGYLGWLNTLGVTGNGVIIANVDNGVDQNHPDLKNRIIDCTGFTCGGSQADSHGTHTAGIMAGDGSSGVLDGLGFLRGLGVAPGADLVEQLYDPFYKNPGGMLMLMTESYRNGAVISGNSWGSGNTPRGYDADTRLVDIGVRDADPDEAGDQPLTYVLSIMNGYGGTSSQGSPDEAKNIFSVGSTFMQYYGGTQNPNINDISTNSAHGPALDGRNLPDIVAPGNLVDSTNYPGNGYALKIGTSMASPQVSGAAALFYEWYRNQFDEVDPSPALVKAAFLPVAHDLAGHKDANGLTLGHPFDSKQGWGRLNLVDVLNPPGDVIYFDQGYIFTETGQTWSYNITLDNPVQSLRAMLVWTDAPGHGLGGNTPAWVNDLDLSIEAGGQTYFGNNFGVDGLSLPGGASDDKNNTEGIFLGAIPAGNYMLTVTAANLSGDGVPSHPGATDQDFALVIYLGNALADFNYQYIFPIFYQ